jgi:membrane-bound lytic murein transglycosylase A
MRTWFLCLLFTSVLSACVAPTKPDKMLLHRATYRELAGWESDNHQEALAVFQKGCAPFMKMAEKKTLNGALAITAGDMKPICERALHVKTTKNGEARQFFELHFIPYHVSNHGKREGLFTGYYEIDLPAALRPSFAHTVPLYRLPPAKLPRYTRAEINRGALSGLGLELAYAADPVLAFFLHIQGSGRLHLPGGKIMRVGYAGQNGFSYVAIGKMLIERGEISREQMSAQAIQQWLYYHPGEAQALMEMNPSYVFFKEIEGDGPLGAQGVALTALRSLAVDKNWLSYGLPVWLDTQIPKSDAHFRRIMIAQDTGGAIRGPVRGDIFFGNGPEAATLAGYMKGRGEYTVLIPYTVDETRLRKFYESAHGS